MKSLPHCPEDQRFLIEQIGERAHLTAPNAPLVGGVLLQQVERSAAYQAKVGRRVVFSGAVGIFAELHVEYPVLLIFDGPVTADRQCDARKHRISPHDFIGYLKIQLAVYFSATLHAAAGMRRSDAAKLFQIKYAHPAPIDLPAALAILQITNPLPQPIGQASHFQGLRVAKPQVLISAAGSAAYSR